MINDEKPAGFDFSDYEDKLWLNTYDFAEGEKITFRKANNGFILEDREFTFKDDKGFNIEKAGVIGYVVKNGQNEIMKINNKTLRNLRAVCNRNVENLIGKQFRVSIENSGDLKYIVLRLA